MTKVLYAGSFDPITNGHINLIKNASRIFDYVYIVVSNNTQKKYLFNLNERTNFVKNATSDLKNVEVIVNDDLTTKLAIELKVDALLRGIRSGNDFEFESSIADLNQTQVDGIQTILLPSDAKYRSYSSSMIKEIAKYHGNLVELVPKSVANALKEKFK